MRDIYYGDCVTILNDEKYIPSASVDLIYLDPPFNSDAKYNILFGKRRDRSQLIAFSDMWTWKPEDNNTLDHLMSVDGRVGSACCALRHFLGESGLLSYLLYMAERLIPLRRILKQTGSLYLHCDPTASHYLKIIMDTIFGAKNFRNEIIWGYRTGGISKKWWPKKHDVLLLYGKDKEQSFHHPMKERIYYDKPFFTDNVDDQGIPYADVYVRDLWDDIKPLINVSGERLGYPTQKPLALLQRIIETSSQEGEVILDPFCGCGTSLDAAEHLHRQWIGLDISILAVNVIQKRLAERYPHIKNCIDVKAGLPTSLEGARAFAHQTMHKVLGFDPQSLDEAYNLITKEANPEEKYGKNAGRFEFQRWAISLIDGMPNDRELWDGGVDGKLVFPTLTRNVYDFGAIQVKSGRITANDIRALQGVVTTQRDFSCGLLITLEKVDTPSIRQICSAAGTWKYAWNQRDYPRLQVWSIADYFAGNSPNIPTPFVSYKPAQIDKIGVQTTIF